MKKFIFVVALSFISTSAFALTQLKIVAVKQSGNLMPPVQEGAVLTTATIQFRACALTQNLGDSFKLSLDNSNPAAPIMNVTVTDLLECFSTETDHEIEITSRAFGPLERVIVHQGGELVPLTVETQFLY